MTYQNQELEFTIIINDEKKSFKDGVKSKTITGAKSVVQIETLGGRNSNRCSATIFGLNIEDIAIITQAGIWQGTTIFSSIYIKANGETVYQGTITECTADFNSAPDIAVKIDSLPAIALASSVSPAFSYGGEIKASDAIESIIKPFGMTLINAGVDSKLLNPHYDGNALNQLNKICTTINCFYEIGYESVFISNGKPRDSEVIEISPDKFLIGYPVFSGEYLTIKTYFNSSYKVQNKIKLDTYLPLASGDYTIYGINHNLTSNFENGSFESILTLIKAKKK